jgi:hypothetical protein
MRRRKEDDGAQKGALESTLLPGFFLPFTVLLEDIL